MYSYEDRIRAVTLYIQLGKRVAATIQQLGYPTKNSLKSWHREYEQGRALKTAVVRPPKFTAEQKARAVEHYLTHGRCVAFTIKALGYPGGPHFTLGFKSSIPGLGHACLEHRRTSRSTLRCSHCAHVKDASKPLLTTLACVERRCTTGAINYWGQRLSHR
jgi:transposase-like protein